MCGIYSYIGNREAAPLLLEGLKLLEYRGYDSAGVAVSNGARVLSMAKAKGKARVLDKKIAALDGDMGISHTRWATHGGVSDENAHPHVDCTGKIAIVHNGIVENADELRKQLENQGHTFKSETDSEVVAHLLESFQGPLEKSMQKAMGVLEGTFAIAAMDVNEHRIVGARRGSPLVLGHGKEEFFLASDTSPFLKYTRTVDFIDENRIIVLEKGKCLITDANGNEIPLRKILLKETHEEMDMAGHDTYMHKEIHEQPDVVRKNVASLGGKAGFSLGFSKEYVKGLRRIIITACGTSWHAGLIGKYIIESALGIPVEVDYASEFRYRDPLVSENDLFIGISQSGETADTLAALREAKKRGARTLGIINVSGSTMAREVDKVLPINAGKEIGVASTKAFTAQVLALNKLVLYLDDILETMNKDERQLLVKEMRALPIKIEAALAEEKHIERIAKDYNGRMTNSLFMGRGVNFPTALEGALKLKEISYVHAEGYPAAEMKHGPIALIDENMPSIFVANNGNQLYHKVLSNMQEVKARGGKIIAITDHEDESLRNLANHVVRVPKTHTYLSPIVNVVPLQLFAYHVATMRNLDVDKPRNLAKSVTVE